jgi:hypothetical protein
MNLISLGNIGDTVDFPATYILCLDYPTETMRSLPDLTWLTYHFRTVLSLPLRPRSLNRRNREQSIFGESGVDAVEVESRIRELSTSVDSWHSSLPIGLRFTLMEDDGQVFACHKLSLALQYYSARIMLGRPWLDREEVQPCYRIC